MLINLIRGRSSDVDFSITVYAQSISVVAWGELLIGNHLTNQSAKERRRITLVEDNVNILPTTKATAPLYARIYAQLRRAGKQIPTNDIWIAASALEHDLPLDTTDAHFALVPGLRLV